MICKILLAMALLAFVFAIFGAGHAKFNIAHFGAALWIAAMLWQ